MMPSCRALSEPDEPGCTAVPERTEHYRLLELLAASATDLLQAEDLGATLDRIFAVIRCEVQLDVFFHYAFDDLSPGLDLVAHSGLTPEQAEAFRRLELGEAICGKVAQRRTLMVGNNVQMNDDPDHAPARVLGLGGFYGAPLLHKDRLLGTLAFGRRSERPFTPAELQFLNTLCSYVSLAKHRIGVDQELRARLQERDRILAERIEIERKMLEMTRTSALGSIAATVAHELNQPLSAAANFIATIRLSPGSDANIRDLSASAERQLQRAGEIIRRLRHMVRHEDPVAEIHPLATVIEEALRLVRATAPTLLPPVTLSIDAGASHARFDNVRIVQVLANLLRNAGDACRARSDPTVTVRAERLSNSELALHVIDTGPGIPAALKETLFQPGFAAKRPGGTEGLGLGLSMSRELIESHGGRIWASDTPGGGATVSFTLPAAAPAEPQLVSAL